MMQKTQKQIKSDLKDSLIEMEGGHNHHAINGSDSDEDDQSGFGDLDTSQSIVGDSSLSEFKKYSQMFNNLTKS